MTTDQHMGRTEWALMLILSLFWGASFFFYKVMAGALPPLTVVLGRMGIAAVMLNIVLRARGGRLPRGAGEWRDYVVFAVLSNVVPFAMFAFGEEHISSGLASILNATTPIFTVLVAHAFTASEKLSWNKAAGVGFGLAGVVILIGPGVLHEIGGAYLLGEIACLVASVSYGFAGVFGRRFRGKSLIEVTTAQATAAAVMALPLAAVVDHPWTLPMPSLAVWGALVGIATVSTVLAYLIYFHVLAKAGATNISLVTFLVPVSAVLLGVLFLGEEVNANAIAGMLVIGLGLAAIDGRPFAWLRRPSPT
ncbi:MAG: DMT family transporter [Alphaproteobacteria bacterium]|nr:DMT family transporter [Alphaproteobacteria bacterium]